MGVRYWLTLTAVVLVAYSCVVNADTASEGSCDGMIHQNLNIQFVNAPF